MDINRKLKIFRCAFKAGATPFASLFVTRQCNLACHACSARLPAAGPELSTGEWIEALRRLSGFGVKSVSFNGGEPLLRDDIGDLIRYAALDQGCLTWLFTNLSLLTDAKLKKLKNLDFLCASYPDLTRSPDQAFLDNLKRCEKQGITPAVLVTVTASNADSLLPFARLCTEQGVLLDIGLLHAMNGRFSSDHSEKRPSDEQLRKLCKGLAELRAKTGRILPSYPLLRKAAEFYRKSDWKCPVKNDPYIVIDADGTLMPCQEYASNLSLFDIQSLKDERWRKIKKKAAEKCPGCAWTGYYQKTFRNPFDLLQESVVLLKF